MLAAEADSVPPIGRDLAVDVVIDNYNYGSFLGPAIESALAQSHPNTRVIVVDDGSTDYSRQVMIGYGDQITPIYKVNGGQASALNAGLAHCRGDVVIFLDADDLLLPHAAERVAAVFVEQPGVVKVQCRMAVIDELGRPTGVMNPSPHLRLPMGDLRRSELTFPFDLTWTATSGNAFSTVGLQRIAPIPETEFVQSADWYLQHLVALLGNVVSIEEPCACYRLHGANRYALGRADLDLTHIRQSIRYAAATRRHLRRLAGELGLAMPPGPILSVADLANRLISCKLEPDAHPLPADRVARLAFGGVLAAARRFDVRWPMKLMFVGWFAGMAMAPRRAAPPFAEVFMFPERRRRLNPMLAMLTKPKAAMGTHERGSASASPRGRRVSQHRPEDEPRRHRGHSDGEAYLAGGLGEPRRMHSSEQSRPHPPRSDDEQPVSGDRRPQCARSGNHLREYQTGEHEYQDQGCRSHLEIGRCEEPSRSDHTQSSRDTLKRDLDDSTEDDLLDDRGTHCGEQTDHYPIPSGASGPQRRCTE